MLVTLLVVLPLGVLAAVLVVLSAATAGQIGERLGAEIVRAATDRVRSDVTGYLAAAVRVSDDYVRRVERGMLPTAGLRAWEPAMLATLQSEPDVASICFANANEDATWLLRGSGRLELGRSEARAATELVVNERGEPVGAPIRTYEYKVAERPWYRAGVGSRSPRWTPVYFWFGNAGADSTTGAGYTRAVLSPDGSQAGVLVVDVTLSAISEFLRKLPVAERGFAYIVDDEWYLVAASEGPVNRADGGRATLQDSPSAAAQAAGVAAARGPRDRAIDLNGRPARVSFAPLEPYPGVNWRIVTVLPEDVYMADAWAVQRRSVVFALAAVVVALVFGVALSRALANPLVRVVQHVRKVGSGDLETRLDLRAARELVELSDELNRMSAGLRERLALQQSLALAMQVQQSLLPSADPKRPRLDIAGRSRYCDETGGDYYDFVEVARAPGGGLMVAVGDVMGHGVSSALLMASARGAVRTHAPYMRNLGELLTNVNRVLADDARHGRFMTLGVLIADPDAGRVRYSSAGHDPAILYRAASDDFIELEGGDLPLGVYENTTYQEYACEGIARGDVILLGTDGIWETVDANNEQFGKDRLRELMRRHAAGPAAQLADAIERAVQAHRGAGPVEDDVTFVVVRLG